MSEIVKTLGGDRLGSGNKNKVRMHNFERSTHDLSESFKSTMGPGMLIPCYCNVGLNGDTFELNIDAGVKTIPTKAPLFGSFKLQVDYFSCPMRLYQGILHNNPINIGLKMGQVKLPKIKFIQHKWRGYNEDETDISPEAYEDAKETYKFAENSLEKYLGLSGIGINQPTHEVGNFTRTLMCVPELAYYDIFKCYYANKQEENAYMIASPETTIYLNSCEVNDIDGGVLKEILPNNNGDIAFYIPQNLNINEIHELTLYIRDTGITNDYKKLNIKYLNETHTWEEWEEKGLLTTTSVQTNDNIKEIYFELSNYDAALGIFQTTFSTFGLQTFALENIDKMRYKLLAHTTLGESYVIDDTELAPYCELAKMTIDGKSKNSIPLNGIVVKTYQSDLYNNWVQTEWIDGENGINAITSVSVNGSFTIDALNLASKVYDMLNRIAVSGGTYQDWMEAVYGEKVARHIETPIYLGGMSSEVVFDVVTSTAASGDSPLGSLGGRGRLQGKKGGKIIVKCTEPTIIIGIVSLTPRIDYAEGNAWYRTELDSVNDLHKPSLDQIGFQDLLEESMAWWSNFDSDESLTPNRRAIGKQPAWINYMTAVDKVYGDFAKTDGKAFMVLQRFYTIGEGGAIADATTYIDPTKYNYVFADAQLDSQNFWVQVYTDVKARRKMSAKQIPNL